MVVCVLVPLRMDGDSLWQSNKYTFRKNHIDHMKGEKYAENFSEFLKLKEEKDCSPCWHCQHCQQLWHSLQLELAPSGA